MKGLLFLACFTPHKAEYKDLIPEPQLMYEDWSCVQMPWANESMVKVKTNDCNMTGGTVYVTKTNGSHFHYRLEKFSECKWSTTDLLKATTCKDIKNVTITQDYSEEK